MALLDEWQVPEPSPYFDVRLRARLREEESKQLPAGCSGCASLPWHSPSRPVGGGRQPVPQQSVATRHTCQSAGSLESAADPGSAEPGTAVGDLQMLDKNHDLYSDFDLLDDLAVEQDVTANP